MSKEISPIGPHKDFESIKKIDQNGVEYWTARELMSILGYSKWQNFEIVVGKAQQACINSRQFPQDHFTDTSKMTQVGHGIVRKLDDFKLDRYACYLIAQNGDSSKPEIAMAQTYFAIQTRNQEILENMSVEDERLNKRKEVSNKNKQLFSTARLSGVSNFGKFNDAGYTGLYTIPLADIEKKKGIKKGELLDRASGVELAANLFRITQTEDKLKRENIKGDLEAQKTHFDIGKKVRQTIQEIGGTMPEHLPPEKHIKELKKEQKVLKGKLRKRLK